MKFTYRWNNFTSGDCRLPSAACTSMISIVIKSGYQHYQRLTSYSWERYSILSEVRATQRHPLPVLLLCNMRPGLVIITLLTLGMSLKYKIMRDALNFWSKDLAARNLKLRSYPRKLIASLTKISLLMLYVHQNNPCSLWQSHSMWENFSVFNTVADGMLSKQYALRD
jgi:hypothetical protein